MPESRNANNTLYFELGGSGILYSFNYERFLANDVSLRLGLMYLGVDAASGSTSASAKMFVFPLTASYLGVRSGAHALELGGGLDVVYASASVSDSSTSSSAFGSGSGAAATAIVGYRYAPLDGGFNFRAAFTPLIGSGGVLPWFGLAFGYGF